MAFGQNTRIVAFPQPGTSNQPFPVGNLPPFVPVVTTITDTHTEAIIDKTTKLTLLLEQQNFILLAELAFISAALNQLNNNLSRLNDISIAQIDAVSNLETAILVKTSVDLSATALTATKLTNQIKNNNLGMAINNESPEVTSLNSQLEENVRDSIKLNTIALTSSTVTSFINSTVDNAFNLISGTSVYKSISSWLSSARNAIVGAIIPSSLNTASSNAAAIAGQKNIVGN